MSRRDRLRRTAKLCLHCLRNLAFYRAAADARSKWDGEQFWVTTHNNFLDIAVLEWCKVFGDEKGKHDWRKTVTGKEEFLSNLLDHIRLTDDFFNGYIGEMRTYRDKFVAHLDQENRMDIPNMAPAIKSAQFLYSHLLRVEDDCDAFPDAPASPTAFFRQLLEEARDVYAAKAAT